MPGAQFLRFFSYRKGGKPQISEDPFILSSTTCWVSLVSPLKPARLQIYTAVALLRCLASTPQSSRVRKASASAAPGRKCRAIDSACSRLSPWGRIRTQ